MKKNILGLFFGTVFGFWLCWTTFTEFDTIFGALVFQDFYLWFMFATALALSTLGLRLLRRSGSVTLIDRKPIGWKVCSPSRDIYFGSVLFGIGWAIAGTCPGPAAAQIGQGHLSGLFTLAGILVGIVICDVLDERATQAVATVPMREEPAGAGSS